MHSSFLSSVLQLFERASSGTPSGMWLKTGTGDGVWRRNLVYNGYTRKEARGVRSYEKNHKVIKEKRKIRGSEGRGTVLSKFNLRHFVQVQRSIEMKLSTFNSTDRVLFFEIQLDMGILRQFYDSLWVFPHGVHRFILCPQI